MLKIMIVKAAYGYGIDLVEFEILENHLYMVIRIEPKWHVWI